MRKMCSLWFQSPILHLEVRAGWCPSMHSSGPDGLDSRAEEGAAVACLWVWQKGWSKLVKNKAPGRREELLVLPPLLLVQTAESRGPLVPPMASTCSFQPAHSAPTGLCSARFLPEMFTCQEQWRHNQERRFYSLRGGRRWNCWPARPFFPEFPSIHSRKPGSVYPKALGSQAAAASSV